MRSTAAPKIKLTWTYRHVTKTERFAKPAILLGRHSQKATVDLDFPDVTVSRKQAILEWKGRTLWITDTNSRTGTWLNGQRLPRLKPRPVDSGNEIQIGETVIVVEYTRKGPGQSHDVFLCHNSRDLDAVQEVADKLMAAGIRPWLDDIKPGMLWVDVLGNAVQAFRAAIVFGGPHGTGPWARLEIHSLLARLVRSQVLLIPAILQGVETEPEWPPFLDLIHRVDFRSNDPDPMALLISTIEQHARVL